MLQTSEDIAPLSCDICIGNSMICSDMWHKYYEWYFEIVRRNLRQFWNITSGIYAKYQVQIMLFFVYTSTHKRFVIFTCRYFKLSWNTTALSQSNCRNFSCRSKSNCAFLDLKWTFDGKQQPKIKHSKKNFFFWLICPRYNLIAFHE